MCIVGIPWDKVWGLVTHCWIHFISWCKCSNCTLYFCRSVAVQSY